MTKQQLITLAAESIRGEHGEIVRFAAGTAMIYTAMAGVVISPARQLADEVAGKLDGMSEQEIMDYLTVIKGRNNG